MAYNSTNHLNLFSFNHSEQEHGEAPSPRRVYGLVEDGGRIIVFGGRGSSGNFNDVHFFDLLTLQWTFLAVSGTPPSPRSSSGMAADCGRVFIFGGKPTGVSMSFILLIMIELSSYGC
jgi:hypothetical protein